MLEAHFTSGPKEIDDWILGEWFSQYNFLPISGFSWQDLFQVLLGMCTVCTAQNVGESEALVDPSAPPLSLATSFWHAACLCCGHCMAPGLYGRSPAPLGYLAWAIHFRAGVDDPSGSLPAQTIM